MIGPLLRTMRPRHWAKNLAVGTPVLFAQKLTDGQAALRAAAAVGVFCLLSSAVYLWNDVVDREKDRAHPKKRLRPIAAGKLSVRAALVAAVVLATIGLGLAIRLGLGFFAAAAAYAVLNVFYSSVLKRIAYLDVVVIAVGFLLRVTAGALAVRVVASPWLLVCTGLGACFLGFGKRAHEAGLQTSNEARPSLAAYRASRSPLRLALWGTGLATVGAYLAYTLAEHTRTFFHTNHMVWTSPLVLIGLARFATLVDRPGAESPTDEMLRDPVAIATFVAWAAAVVGIIYWSRA